MRSPRVVYGVVAAMLAVAGFVLPRLLADQSGPELGETVVVTPGTTRPPGPPSVRPTGPGAGQVTPAPVRTAGDDADDDADDTDDGPDDDD